ncbi:HD domain-containing phosphohydrolase [Magnetospirillum sulfuroxidans]|uniref:HD domain-containing protein n=1 Tax=Magnetospirillum sulfuroxidans TaxID=611300 RepID=A0ABS5I8A3_9PROT|nr:HD domain-containing phosphohydrolase [Magnetospirillum sulfuroxidans]MBR9970640.1 HD domain-containing protein [Magnetospirillum sulfuroxidans]
MYQLPAVHRGIAERLICLHDEIKGERSLASLSRIAVALYDGTSDLLKTFIHSSDGDNPVDGATAQLADCVSLKQLASTGARRIVNDLAPAAHEGREFARRLYDAGYRSSYTVPIVNKGTFYGFLFFNSFETGFFQPAVVQRLRPYAELISLAVMRELDTVRMMQAAVKVIRSVSSARDEETGSHLARMARYARLIATKMPAHYGLTDEFVEFLFQFCPLHDVGKIAVPDAILLKPGRLTEDEFEQMKKHVDKGLEIIDLMMRDFGLKSMPYLDVLRNIVAYHHESLDGSGYPFRLKGDQIPIESRIAAVADVFDALTSERPYKKAWTNDEAMQLLRQNAGTKFDADCVDILLSNKGEIEQIQARFAETVFD